MRPRVSPTETMKAITLLAAAAALITAASAVEGTLVSRHSLSVNVERTPVERSARVAAAHDTLASTRSDPFQ